MTISNDVRGDMDMTLDAMDRDCLLTALVLLLDRHETAPNRTSARRMTIARRAANLIDRMGYSGVYDRVVDECANSLPA